MHSNGHGTASGSKLNHNNSWSSHNSGNNHNHQHSRNGNNGNGMQPPIYGSQPWAPMLPQHNTQSHSPPLQPNYHSNWNGPSNSMQNHHPNPIPIPIPIPHLPPQQQNGLLPNMNPPMHNSFNGNNNNNPNMQFVPSQLLQEALRMSAPVGSSANDDNLLAQVLYETKKNGKTYKLAIESLHGV